MAQVYCAAPKSSGFFFSCFLVPPRREVVDGKVRTTSEEIAAKGTGSIRDLVKLLQYSHDKPFPVVKLAKVERPRE